MSGSATTSRPARLVARSYPLLIPRLLGRPTEVARLRRSLRLFDALAPPPRSRSSLSRGRVNGVVVDRLRARSGSLRHVLYLPGGAFIVRTPRWHRLLFSRICAAADAGGSLVFYRLAPEHPFPAALDDALGVYAELLASEVAPSEIVFGGDSAGGGLVLSMLLALRDRGLPLPGRAFVMSPLADLGAPWDSGSRFTNRASDSLIALLKGLDYAGAYLGDGRASAADPLVSPVTGSFAGLPPLLVQASRSEILRDDAVAVAAAARAGGADCRLELYDGLPHVWQLLPGLPEAIAALGSIGAFAQSP
jgi:epsilon-lactone hydrolase